MKLWKKVYLLAMVIIAISVNIGFFGIVYFTYGYMLQAEQQRCEVEFEVIYESLIADIAKMEENVSLDIEYFQIFMNAYNSYFETDTQLIGVVDDTILGEHTVPNSLSMEDGVYIYDEGQTRIYCVQSLDSSHSKYGIILVRTLTEFDKIWDTLRPLYIAGGTILSLGVSLVLATVVRIVLKPLDELENTAKQMEAGNWSARTHIEGDNELAQLGRQFNAMADSVEVNIKKLEEQSEQKQQLIHNMAHEMNTPITSIRGFADYMQMSVLSEEEQQECLAFIISESKRLKDISSTVLSMAEIQNGQEMKKQDFSIKNMCNRLENLYQKQFQEKQVSLEIHCHIEQMTGNEALIESLLRNLIINAYYAVLDRDEGKIQVEIGEENEQIKLVVSDNGCGIAKKDAEQIFEPFYRVDKARSRDRGGTGLGLAFCKRIVETHNGCIKVDSELEKGTQFIVNFTV